MSATPKESEPVPAATAPLVIEVDVAAISPHPDNPRTFPKEDGDDPGLVELAASIKAVGLLEPVLVRPLVTHGTGNAPGLYQLVAGERRWRACRLAGLERIPAVVRVLDDRQALEVLVTENLQREDLQPLEEARGIRALVDRAGWTIADVADRLGRSVYWVAQRARLTDLSERWRKAVEDPTRGVSRWPASFLVEVARLDPAAQDEFDKENYLTEQDHETELVGLCWIREEIAHMLRKVSAAPWKADDAALYPEAGACSACQKRSSCCPSLFEDEDAEKPKKTDRCLDVVCWKEKSKRYLVAREAQLRAEHDNLVLLHGEWSPREHNRERKDAADAHKFETAKKSEIGAMPALVVDGKGKGTVRWVKPRREYSDSPSVRPKGLDGVAAPKPMKERRALLDRRRKAAAVAAIRIQVGVAPTPATDLLVRLAAVFGTSNRRDAFYFDGFDGLDDKGVPIHPEGVWKLLGRLSKALSETSSRDLLWMHVSEVMAHRLQYMGWQTNMKKLWDDAKHQCEVLGLDSAAALQEAIAAIPEPKSWAGLNADGTPKSHKGKKAAKPAKTKKASKPVAGVCRVCGCTEDNACETAEGDPCHWAEPDLCSACVEDEIDEMRDEDLEGDEEEDAS